MKKKLAAIACTFFILLLAACGGGGGGTTGGNEAGGGAGSGQTLNPARGFFDGSSGSGQDVAVAILGDGTLYALHLDPITGEINGVLFGNGTVANGKYSVENGVEFSFAIPALRQFALSATYQPRSRVQGEISFDDATTDSFDLTYDSLYEQQPSLERLAGSYAGALSDQTLPGELTGASMTILANGDISGSGQNGCGFAGNAAPRSDGNVYDISISYNSGQCSGSYSGIAIVDDGAGKFVTHLAANAARNDVFLFIGE